MSPTAASVLTTYSWDDPGNNTVVNAAGTLTTYTWDGENRLSVIALPTAEILTLTYDATGLRRKRQECAGATDYLWDLENLLMELSAGATEAQYTTAAGTYGPVVSSRRGATSRFLMTDALGSVVGLLDPLEAESDSYVYKSFADLAASSGSTVNPFRYVGGLGYYHEADACLNYVRARWLRPTTGSWLSVDSVEGERYGYVWGCPCDYVDPAGRMPVRVFEAVGGLYVRARNFIRRTPKPPREFVDMRAHKAIREVRQIKMEQKKTLEDLIAEILDQYGPDDGPGVGGRVPPVHLIPTPSNPPTPCGTANGKSEVICAGFGAIIGAVAQDPITAHLGYIAIEPIATHVYFPGLSEARAQCVAEGNAGGDCADCCGRLLPNDNDRTRCEHECWAQGLG